MPFNNGFPGGVLFIQTADATVASTAAETTLTATGRGSLTLPANFFGVGKSIRVIARGIYSETANPTLRFKVKFGSTIILDTTAVSLSGSGTATNAEWALGADITCRTTGVSGTVAAQGRWVADQNAATATVSLGMANTGTVVVDTTITQLVGVTIQWGTADSGNSMKCSNLVVEGFGP